MKYNETLGLWQVWTPHLEQKETKKRKLKRNEGAAASGGLS